MPPGSAGRVVLAGGALERRAGPRGHLVEVAGLHAVHVDPARAQSSIAAASTPGATNLLPSVRGCPVRPRKAAQENDVVLGELDALTQPRDRIAAGGDARRRVLARRTADRFRPAARAPLLGEREPDVAHQRRLARAALAVDHRHHPPLTTGLRPARLPMRADGSAAHERRCAPGRLRRCVYARQQRCAGMRLRYGPGAQPSSHERTSGWAKPQLRRWRRRDGQSRSRPARSPASTRRWGSSGHHSLLSSWPAGAGPGPLPTHAVRRATLGRGPELQPPLNSQPRRLSPLARCRRARRGLAVRPSGRYRTRVGRRWLARRPVGLVSSLCPSSGVVVGWRVTELARAAASASRRAAASGRGRARRGSARRARRCRRAPRTGPRQQAAPGQRPA